MNTSMLKAFSPYSLCSQLPKTFAQKRRSVHCIYKNIMKEYTSKVTGTFVSL